MNRAKGEVQATTPAAYRAPDFYLVFKQIAKQLYGTFENDAIVKNQGLSIFDLCTR